MAQDNISQMEPTPFMGSLTCPHKAYGILRVYLDLQDLNKAIIWEYHKALTLEEITHRLSVLTYSTLDAKMVCGACTSQTEKFKLTSRKISLQTYALCLTDVLGCFQNESLSNSRVMSWHLCIQND